MNVFIFLTFFYMFINFSTFTFTTISYIPIYSHRETCAAKCTKSPAAEFYPCGGACNAKLLFLPSYQHDCQSYGRYYK